jgi:hypothetical protein
MQVIDPPNVNYSPILWRVVHSLPARTPQPVVIRAQGVTLGGEGGIIAVSHPIAIAINPHFSVYSGVFKPHHRFRCVSHWGFLSIIIALFCVTTRSARFLHMAIAPVTSFIFWSDKAKHSE